MIQISKRERYELDRIGLLRYKKTGLNPQEPNFVIVNRRHKSRGKKYYVVETPEILAYLQIYDTLNLQIITEAQVNELKEKKLITDKQIQKSGEYVPNAVVYVSKGGQYRMKKIASLMITLGIWKTRNKQQ